MRECEEFRLSEVESSVSAMAGNAVSVFVYYPKQEFIWIPETVAREHHCDGNYFDAPKQIAENFLYEDSRENYLQMYRRLKQGSQHVQGIFQSRYSLKHFRVSLTVAKRDDAGQPVAAIGELHFVDEKNVVTKIANGISTMFESIYYIWVKDRTFFCYQENMSNILDDIGHRGESETAWRTYIEKHVEPEYREKVRLFCDFESINERFRDVNSLSCKHKRIGLGWTRGTYIVTKRDKNHDPAQLLYVVTDINQEVEMEMEKLEAEFEAEHDTLTGLFNRKTFRKFSTSEAFCNAPVGFMLLDVDRFKDINDAKGHLFGDDVLCHVASMLETMFRKDDLVFRLGGDEFAILFHNGDSSAWANIVQKLRAIHSGLREIYPQQGLTLSAGLCFAEGGYTEKMFGVADAALYRTKCNGKAGCIMMDIEGNEISHWFDDDMVYAPGHVLSQNEVGAWRLEIPQSGDTKLYCDENMQKQLLIPNNLTPEESFQFFLSRTLTESQSMIKQLLLSMEEGKVSEIRIPWKHPQSGTIFMRFGGRKNLNQKRNTTFIGYYHVMEDTSLLADYEETIGIRSALEEHYYCNYYIDLETKAFTAYKSQDFLPIEKECNTIDKAFLLYLEKMVQEDSYASMKRFLDTNTLKERLRDVDFVTQEYFSTNKEHGWCRARFIVVKRDMTGLPTNVCFVIEEINKEKQLEIAEQKARTKSFMIRGKMIHLLSRSQILLVGYVNVKTGMVKYEEREMDAVERPEESYQEILEFNRRYISEKEQNEYLKLLSLEHVLREVQEKGEYHCSFTAKSEEKKFFNIMAHAMNYDDEGKQLLLVVEDVSEITSNDSVSGALNRDGFARTVAEILETSSSVDEFYMLDFNIQQFKNINAQYDSYEGDKVLRDAAEHLKNSSLHPLAVCRNNDDRFYCLVRDEDMSLQHLSETRSFTSTLMDGPHQMEFSCGVYRIEDKSEPVMSICDRAMLALTKNKTDNTAAGYYIFDDELNESYLNNVFVMQNLTKALQRKEFSVAYQPIFDARTKQVVSAEALVRWNSCEKGMISPGVFVPALEKAGKMYRVDEYVAEEVFAFQQNRYAENKSVVPVALNLSRMDLYRKDFLDKSLKRLTSSEMPAELIRYEVTESAIMSIPNIGVQFLDAVRNEGSMIMVDDFGTGASALRTIAERAYDAIKIDKSFIDDIGNSERVEAVILSAIDLGHKLGLRIIAEGVETDKQYKFLRDNDCDYIQGYYFSKPLSEDDFTALLNE